MVPPLWVAHLIISEATKEKLAAKHGLTGGTSVTRSCAPVACTTPGTGTPRAASAS